MNLDLHDVARTLSPVTLQERLRSRGFALEVGRSGADVVVYHRDGLELDVPLRTDFADYGRRIEELVGLLAAVEKVSPLDLLDTLLEPAGDVLALRVSSEATAIGTIPFEDSLRIRQATKTLLLAAAHSALSAQSWFPRLARSEALGLLGSIQEGQTKRGSFTARFIVPVEPTIGLFDEEDPYGRRVTKLLLRALDGVRRVRALGTYDGLLMLQKEGVSGNLLGALASMAPPGGAGSLELSVSWSRNRPSPKDIVPSVRFPGEALVGLDTAAEAMRGQEKSKGFEVIGYIFRLDRKTQDKDAGGEIMIAPTDGEARELGKISARLDAASYAEAISAHGEGRKVRVIGTLQKAVRRWTLADASAFERYGDADEP